ncbi:hypothetical protein Ahy_B09g096404 [Arachis hypogaea]|uniref:DUF4218 domain-containing protein n=1 Tax=Arachis hypogaea TaxID=3818 RepID=A0A444XKE7_ARAHY|nr:hypothetical protein Ahy_B09g096404 [Arachis hypogaea]
MYIFYPDYPYILSHVLYSQRYLCCLKQYVRNRARPEGSIAEGYLSEEILIFCSRYLDNVDIRINRPMPVADRLCEPMDSEDPGVENAVGAASFYALTPAEKFQAHRHVLVNSPAVEKFIDAFRAIKKRKLRSKTRSQSQIDSVVHKEFFEWFKHEVRPVVINLVIDGLLLFLSQIYIKRVTVL